MSDAADVSLKRKFCFSIWTAVAMTFMKLPTRGVDVLCAKHIQELREFWQVQMSGSR